jgi:hypothetical protein
MRNALRILPAAAGAVAMSGRVVPTLWTIRSSSPIVGDWLTDELGNRTRIIEGA